MGDSLLNNENKTASISSLSGLETQLPSIEEEEKQQQKHIITTLLEPTSDIDDCGKILKNKPNLGKYILVGRQ